MTGWLTETLFYTGLLIALVLVLRNPVARAFGPHAAYALWALPLLRFLIPPIVLPASFAPAEPAPAALPYHAIPPEFATLPAGNPTIADSGPDIAGMLADLALPVWLAGAAAFLVWRGWGYFRMRERLLAEARPVGEAGPVRLVESPAVSSPVAFGVFDKVIALPPGFMAWEDRRARDLAIGHELAHHRGRDLLANILAQPVLALHWFNPLAWVGWRAMRRDQEAACDARVLASSDPHERAYYGEVIASFAAGPRLALAAPMACPMAGRFRGEKSIVHRLRSLNMSEISRRRRLAGRVLLSGAALAVPMTASISYAEAQVPAVPAPPAAPIAPEPPAAPDVEVRHEDGRKVVTVTRELRKGEAPQDGEAGERRVVRKVVVAPSPPGEAEFRRAFELRHEGLSEAEWDRFADEWEKAASEFAAQWERDWSNFASLVELQSLPQNIASTLPQFDFGCDDEGNPVKIERAGGDSAQVRHFVFCRKLAIDADARAALERARASVERDRALSERIRSEVLRSLDRELRRLSQES